jgi:outer membrane protein assembly factor BamB
MCRTIRKCFEHPWVAVSAIALIPACALAAPTVYPTGTTIYRPDKTWSGYTILDTPEEQGAVLIDMNGNTLRQWKELAASPAPFRILPGGYVMGGDRPREPHQESIALVELDWNGKEVWRFDHTEQVQTKDGKTVWAARQHHDWQREGSPVGYFAPGAEPLATSGRTLILTHKNVTKPEITDKLLEDDHIIEVSWSGKILWDWLASDHIDELGFSEDARNAIYRSVPLNKDRGSADWLHMNAMSYVGPNHWFEAGDERFNPENILFSSRNANIIGIIDRSGAIVWRLGPDYRQSEAQAKIGQLIGQHDPHIIPEGLPGAGNLLVFDNGGAAGYGFANPAAPAGQDSLRRFNSRVLEINPVTLEKVWEYSIPGTEQFRFFSQYVSAAQRLPNGNTMITEGADGRIFELDPEGEIVWEYVSPYFGSKVTNRNMMFRAYRVPYEWIPQLPQPTERPVVPPKLQDFHIAAQ